MARYWLDNPWSLDPFAAFDQLRRGPGAPHEWTGPRAVRRTGAFPPVNLYDTPEAFVLTAELPGVPSDAIDVSIEHNRVTLRGDRRIERPAEASLHRVERQSGGFRRAVELPAEVDADKTEAVHRHGVLMLRIPKAEKHQPRRIAVRG